MFPTVYWRREENVLWSNLQQMKLCCNFNMKLVLGHRNEFHILLLTRLYLYSTFLSWSFNERWRRCWNPQTRLHVLICSIRKWSVTLFVFHVFTGCSWLAPLSRTSEVTSAPLLSCQPIGRPSPTHGRSRPRLRTGASVAARDARRGRWRRRHRQAATKLCDRDAGTAAEPPAAPSSRLTCCRSERLHWNLPEGNKSVTSSGKLVLLSYNWPTCF